MSLELIPHRFVSGLSPSTDTAYYQFLLKLGVTRAPTWGERWDLWKAKQSITSNPKRQLLHTSRVAQVRARVPFLASASSDLDEGYADGETYDGDGESLMGATRPSPRRELAKGDQTRSLVGYTPSQSIDYEVVTLNPPIRTSTPLYAQELGYGRSTPHLPPYSVSDTSEALDDSSRLTEGVTTPKAPDSPWPSSDPKLNELAVQELERRADNFYSTGLLGRCWDVWSQAADWVQVDYNHLFRSLSR